VTGFASRARAGVPGIAYTIGHFVAPLQVLCVCFFRAHLALIDALRGIEFARLALLTGARSSVWQEGTRLALFAGAHSSASLEGIRLA